MNKQQLEQIFSTRFDSDSWRKVLTEVFAITTILQEPKRIALNSNKIADSAFELGSFETADNRLIGVYRVNLNDNPKIERNKVGLRSLLRSIYKYDVDGALVVFVQGDKWRFSFISEIRILDEQGNPKKQATEPKRYTYLLGKDEKVRTPAVRLSVIAGKKLTLEDIREAFSVEALNEEFYKIVRDYFYQLVGGTVGKGRQKKTHEKILRLPIAENENNEKYYREFAVRLIGRTIFCWFLKVKKSDKGIPLLPEDLLSTEAVTNNPVYYHHILERLFFQTLNTPMDNRRSDLPNGCEIIPFLNGGLFEPQLEDYYEPNKWTGVNNNLNTLSIPDEWFVEFFEEISHYNFTVDENSPVEIEFGIDPEMLGRIFENLLAEIDPDTGKSARKATGSFYTPREIVSYMVDESLICYLKAKLETETKGFGFQAIDKTQIGMFGNEGRIQQKFEVSLENNRWLTTPEKLENVLRELFFHDNNEHKFNETETEILIKAIDDCKVLDPACGSGAFPIGILQRLVFLLEKLDPNNEKWKAWQRDKAIRETEKAFKDNDKTQREMRLIEINEAFEKDSSDYSRKLFLIERCIYGVDIQPIAAEISKLRCFLTLVVDDTIDDTAENRGVRHLPNLEFKFVTADTLLKLPAGNLFQSNTKSQLTNLENIRHEYIRAYGDRKNRLKEQFGMVQDEIFNKQIENSHDQTQDKRAIALSVWKPFKHEKTDWFDPLWMFGVKEFDIVIGNPPYGAKLSKQQVEKYKKYFELETKETAIFFLEKCNKLLSLGGLESLIIPKSFSFASNYRAARDYVEEELFLLGDCGTAFENVKFEACIVFIRKAHKSDSYISVKFDRDKTFKVISHIDKKLKELFGFFPNGIIEKEIKIGLQIRKLKQVLNDIAENSRGEMVQKHISDLGDFKVIGGKEIDRYGIRGVKGFVDSKFLDGQKGFIKQNSILVQNIVAHVKKPFDHLKITACIPQNTSFVIADTINQIKITDEKLSERLIWAILNSKLINWYSYLFIFGKAIRTMHFDSPVTSRIPVPFDIHKKQKPFENLVDYVLFLKDSDSMEQINEYVPNSHLVEQFEEVINTLVYELYFEEHMKEREIDVLQFVDTKNIFRSIGNDSTDKQKAEIIGKAYKWLQESGNPIRDRIALANFKSKDIISRINSTTKN